MKEEIQTQELEVDEIILLRQKNPLAVRIYNLAKSMASSIDQAGYDLRQAEKKYKIIVDYARTEVEKIKKEEGSLK